jgi:hypothetical protein
VTRRLQLAPSLLSILGASAVTVFGFVEAVGSIHDPSTYRLVVCYLASPFATLLFRVADVGGSTFWDGAAGSTLWYGAIAAGILLWICILYFVAARCFRRSKSA